jgi:hypothetical protein
MGKSFRLMTLFLAAFAVGNVQADDKLSMAKVQMSANQTKEVTISLDNAKAFTAYQFDMTLPEGVTLAKNGDDYVASPGRGTADHQFRVGQISDGKYRFLSYSNTNADLTGTSGTIVTLTLVAGESVAEGAVIKLDGEVFVEGDGTSSELADAEIPVSMAGVETIEFKASGKTTYVSANDLDFSGRDDVKAFIAMGYDVNTADIWLARVEDAPAGTPLWVTGPANTKVDIPIGTSATYYTQSLMYGSATATTPIAASDDNYMNMTLSPGDGKTSKRTSAYDLPAGKAYLHLPLQVASNPGSAQSVTLSAKGKLAYVSEYDLDFSSFGEELKAYTAIGYAKNGDIWFARVMKASAGTPLYLKGAANGEYSIPSSEVKLTWVNMLKGSPTAASVVNMVDGEFTNFLLYKGDGEWAPAQKDYPSLAAGTSFLSVPTAYVVKASTRGNAKNVANEIEAEVMCINLNSLLSDGGDATGIHAIEGSQSNDVWYNLNGQRIDKPAKKGLYIHNGKKIIVK